MSKTITRLFWCAALFLILGAGLVTGAFAQQQTPFFTSGNLVVTVAGCGVYGGTCSNVPYGTGPGNSYGDDQGSPWTLFQYTPSGASSVTYVNSLQLPQNISGANYPVSNDYGSQSEGTIQLSGNGVYLTIMGYGLNAATFNGNYTLFCPGNTGTLASSCVPENGNPAMAQTGSLVDPTYTYSGNVPVPRVAALIDANGNVNSSTVLYNIFNQNDARSAYTANGSTIYVSGQGCKNWDTGDDLCDNSNTLYDDTMGVYLSPVGVTNNAPTPITGPDNGPSGCTNTTNCTSSEDTRMVQIYNGTMYVSQDSKPGSSAGYNRSYIGTLGDPPSNSVFTCTGVGAGCGTGYGPFGPALMAGFGNTGGTGKYTINAPGSGNNSNGNNLNNTGLAINLSPQNFFFASPTVLYVADTGSPKNTSNGPDAVCTADGGKSTATVGDGGLQKWILNPTVTAAVVSGSATVTAPLSGAFTQGEVGLPISGTDIPAGATITAVSSAGKTATMSANATGSDSTDSVTVSGWSLAYTLYNGLNLVLNTDCDPNSPTTQGSNSTTGLYGVTGVVNSGVATLYVTTYPNNDLVNSYLYGITDTLSTTTMTSPGTSFTQLDTAPANSVFRGVSFVPTIPNGDVEVTAVVSGAAAGLTVTTSGSGCNPSTFVTPLTQTWTPGSSCQLSVVTPQVVQGTQYVFSQWQDGSTGTTDTVTAPSTTAVYTATFTVGTTGLYSPTPASTLQGSTATFQWYGPQGTAAFWIDVGSTAGGNNYYQSGSLPTSTLSATISSLPTDGSTVYVTLYWLIDGSWVSTPYTFTAFNLGAAGAVMQTPMQGSTLTGSSATFTWTAGSGATNYWLDVGSTAGGNQYLQSGPLGSVQTDTVNGLPTDASTIYVTLYSLIGGTWTGNAYTYTAFNAAGGAGSMQSPTPNTSLSGSTITFTWNAGSSATAYWLDVGSGLYGNNYYQSGNLGNTLSTTVYSLPANGSTVYVTLWSYVGGQWVNSEYNYLSGP